ncbi:MAG: osmoprotectant transport system substrate-binding protein [Actinomycetota bacterium]|jgi:osmoprotectant transport system substrate-binding protein|nr:osmoprotectant transport system substrate-binding protein [Actinomycetota bacterium]
MRLSTGRSRTTIRLLAVVAVLALVAGACGDDSADTATSGASTTEAGLLSGSSFKVGSKEFTEQLILGQITIQVLEDAGAKVSDETGLVGSNTVRQALISGDIDLYWEYTGTGWINHLGNTAPVKGEREQFDAVAKADLEKNGVTWLEPAPFNNTYGLATSSENAAALAVSKLSDLAALQQRSANDFTLCAAAEFLARDDGLPGLETAYGFSFGDKVSELELGLVYASVDKGDPCKFGEVFATDGRIAALGLKVLDDDKQFFASYLPSLNVRKGVDKIPQLQQLFTPVAAALTTATMQELNSKVDVDGEQPEDVARDFLTEKGLIG